MITKELLESLIEKGYTRKKVAKELGIGYSTVHWHMARHGLKFANSERKISEYNCRCGETDKNKFYGGRKTECKSCFNDVTKEKIRKNKEYAVKYKGGGCSVCGYNKCISALEFHHSDPSQKDPTWRIGWSWERLKIEIDKCVLLCANCHREEHEKISGVGTVG